jgi:hypothetical protein
MLIVDFVIALFVALVISLVLVVAFGWKHPRHTTLFPSFLLLFILLLFMIWAGGVWIGPWGPSIRGSYLFPFVMVGVIVALLVAALVPPGNGKKVLTKEATSRTKNAAGIFLGALFLLLIVAIVSYYLQ